MSTFSSIMVCVFKNIDDHDADVSNAAGTSYPNKPTLEVTGADFDRVFNVNVRSIFLSVGVIVPIMQKQGGGAIINVSSTGSIRPRGGLVWYNASKGAVTNVRTRSCSYSTTTNVSRRPWVLQPSTGQIKYVSTPLRHCSQERDCSRHLSAWKIHPRIARSSPRTYRWDGFASLKMLRMQRCSWAVTRASS